MRSSIFKFQCGQKRKIYDKKNNLRGIIYLGPKLPGLHMGWEALVLLSLYGQHKPSTGEEQQMMAVLVSYFSELHRHIRIYFRTTTEF